MKPAVVSGIILLVLGGYFSYHTGYVRPQAQLGRIQQQVREAQQEQDLRTQVAGSLAALEQHRQRLAPKAEPDWLLQEVGKLAREAGIAVHQLSPQPPRQWESLTYLVVTLQFTASYHQLGQFISQIENAERVIWVEEMEVAPERGGGLAQVRLTLSTLYVPPVTTAAGGR